MNKDLPVWTVSLGCPKNRVDTERLLGSLGQPVRLTPHLGRARLALINTCAFIEPATRESLAEIFAAIRKLARLKRKPLLAVAGCLPGRYGLATLKKEIPEVDLWLESADIDNWPDRLNAALKLTDSAAKARLAPQGPYAWLKIAEGCQRSCAFCAIPAIRGPLQSMPWPEIAAEATALLNAGIRELALVGQDVTAWGRDLLMAGAQPGPRDLPDLLLRLRELPGLAWLRAMYLYPNAITDRLLAVMAEGLPVLPYLDIPLQHSEPRLLAAMGRPFQINPRELVARIRKRLPNAALRTTLMVGYPGETEADFKALLQFVRETRFQNLGVFPFMPEEGTKAALLPDQVPEEIKQERAAELMRLQAEISADLLAEYKGSTMPVLIDASAEQEWPGLFQGRVWFQAPEVDGSTYVSGPDLASGQMREAEIIDSQTYDLSGLV